MKKQNLYDLITNGALESKENTNIETSGDTYTIMYQFNDDEPSKMCGPMAVEDKFMLSFSPPSENDKETEYIEFMSKDKKIKLRLYGIRNNKTK